MLFNFFFFSIKWNKVPFLHFPSPTFVYTLRISPTCGNKLQDFVSVNGIFIGTFFPFQQFITWNFFDISIFKCLCRNIFFMWRFLFLKLTIKVLWIVHAKAIFHRFSSFWLLCKNTRKTSRKTSMKKIIR